MSSLHLAQAIDLIHSHSSGAIVVSCSYPLASWLDQHNTDSFLLPVVDCESDTLALALGIALSNPRQKVIVLQSGETMKASLPSLATVGFNYPKNLFHFVFNLVSKVQSPEIDFVATAQAAGYAESRQFTDLEVFASELLPFLGSEGPKFASLNTSTSAFKTQFPRFLFRDSVSSIMEELATSG